MSIQYSLIKIVFKIIPFQKIMAKPYDQLMKTFKTDKAKPNIPKLSDPEFSFQTEIIDDSPVLMIQHKKPKDSICIYVIGGGMLKYPRPSQAKEVMHLAKKTGRDFALPYFPICPKHDIYDALDMLYDTYKMILKTYKPENVAFLGGSSGASMTLWLISYINHDKKKLPMPGKFYLSSPGSALDEKERAQAEKLNQTDLIMSTTALDNIFAGMAGGKKLPEHLCYTQKGIYTGLKDVYLTYGGNEVFSAAAVSTANRLHSFGTHVQLEIGKDMYHAYSAMPLIPEAKAAYQRMIDYLTVE